MYNCLREASKHTHRTSITHNNNYKDGIEEHIRLMKIVKAQSAVPIEWLWDFEDAERDAYLVDSQHKTSLLFGIFYVDKFASNGAVHLQDVFKKAQEFFKVWNDHYPWSEYNGISMSLEKMEDGTKFIYGQLCVENNVKEEESLVLGLLVQLSSNLGPQVFMRICDTDGDFLMTETISKEIVNPGCNRLWLQCGRLKLIPASDGRGVSPSDALEFLKNSYFKCTDFNSMNQYIATKVTNEFPDKFLSNLARLQLVIENKENCKVLLENPRLISYLLKCLNDEEIIVSKSPPSNSSKKIELLVPKGHCNIIPFFLEAKGLNKDLELVPLFCGRAVSSVLDNLIKKHLLIVKQQDVDADALSTEAIFDPRNFEEASIDMSLIQNSEYDFSHELNDLSELLKKGVNFNEEFDDDLSDPRLQSTEDPDYECKQYFLDEDVDIDEDDFFEFFLKEGLKLSETKIDELRRDEGNHF